MKPGSSGLETFRSLLLNRSFCCRKPLEIGSLADVQFLIDGYLLVSQVNYLSNSYKDYDGLILACFNYKRPDER